MARIIGGSMIGELSGKLGGNVFARNKAGAYIRQYVIPVDPKSIAQMNARNSFGASSSGYHNLTDIEKAEWQSFATNFYLPKNRPNTGQFSGFNAYTSLANVVNTANRLNIESLSWSADANPIAVTASNQFILSSRTPGAQLQANMLSSMSELITLHLSESSQVHTNGSFSISLVLGGINSPIPSSPTLPFQDGAGNEIGFAFYMSNPVQQESMFISNPELYCLGFTPGIANTTTDLSAINTLTINGKAVDVAKYQSFPSQDNWVRLTGYIVGETGQMIRFGSTMVRISIM